MNKSVKNTSDTSTKNTTSKKTTRKSKKVDEKSYIYGIYLSDKLVYIGSTINFEQRKQQHLLKLQQNKHTNKTLTKLFLEDNNIEIKILHTIPVDNSLLRMMAEMCSISYYEPNVFIKLV